MPMSDSPTDILSGTRYPLSGAGYVNVPLAFRLGRRQPDLRGFLMSSQAISWAINQPVSSPAAKLVLLMLANHSNGHTGQCNPSHQRLADECSMSRSSLKTHLANLAEAGYIRIEHRTKGGCSLPNSYVLTMSLHHQN